MDLVKSVVDLSSVTHQVEGPGSRYPGPWTKSSHPVRGRGCSRSTTGSEWPFPVSGRYKF
uniref:Predicted protein n=1 Tax=Hordeum vulgare subsp. vulgare TaxID=112509 RepID=F2DHQ1_HORVV|nr:predicted protein [Hordeum vulgare subsp. vulgare]